MRASAQTFASLYLPLEAIATAAFRANELPVQGAARDSAFALICTYSALLRVEPHVPRCRSSVCARFAAFLVVFLADPAVWVDLEGLIGEGP